MGKMGKFGISDLKKFQKELNQLEKEKVDVFLEACAKELAARLLAKVIKLTPVGDYSKEITVTAQRDGKKHKKGETYTKRVNPSGKLGGTLQRGWTSKTQEEAAGGTGSGMGLAHDYVNSLEIQRVGNQLQITIINPVSYAEYVEFGHRTADHKGFVQGQFMLTESVKKIQAVAPHVLEAKLKKFLAGCIK